MDKLNQDFEAAFLEEQAKVFDLAGRVAELEEKNEELNFKLERIHKNPLWKVTKPLRVLMHFCLRQFRRVKNLGGPRGIIAKIKYKKREKLAMKNYGTLSFPTPERRKEEEETVFANPVKISILVPLYNTPEKFLREMIESVQAQTYKNWELCLADGSDDAHKNVGEICKSYYDADSRIIYKKLEKNEGISGNTNRCYKMATGEYIGLFDHDDVLHPEALFEYVKVINEKGADYIYCDETTFKGDSIDNMLTMHFKPDYAPDNLRANNYICHFSVFKRELLEGTDLFRPKFDGSQDHDMILRLTDNAKCIVHVPRLLYYWRSHAGSTASNINAKTYAIDAAKGAVADHLRHHGYEHFHISSTRAFETIFRIRYEIKGNPPVSIVIANKDHYDDLNRLLTSIEDRSTYTNFEIVIVENNSTEERIFEYYSDLLGFSYDAAAEVQKSSGEGALLGKIPVTIVTYKGKFNYSAVNNLGVKHSTGEYLLLLNNDMEVISVDWIEELLMYAQRGDVGAVGGKLYYADRTIQHAGVVIGLGAHRTAGHTHYKQSRENLGYMGRLCYAQNVSAVTGACLMVSRENFDAVGGLDEGFEISLNDVDLCLKLREKGLLNVFTPFCELYHYESASRGLDDQGEKLERYNKESEKFREKWKVQLEAGDPYYNPNFSLDRSDFSLKI